MASPGAALSFLFLGVDRDLAGLFVGDAAALLADWPPQKLQEAKASGSLMEASEVAEVIRFMLTRPRGMTIRDVVLMPSNFDL